jgi:hypothetical protein
MAKTYEAPFVQTFKFAQKQSTGTANAAKSNTTEVIELFECTSAEGTKIAEITATVSATGAISTIGLIFIDYGGIRVLAKELALSGIGSTTVANAENSWFPDDRILPSGAKIYISCTTTAVVNFALTCGEY